MTWIFKTIGLVLLFLCCSLLGFLKSSSLKKRADKLSLFIKNLCELAERIRTGEGEIDKLCAICFDKKIGTFNDDTFIVNKENLKREDFILLSDFFENLGMRNKIQEYERCQLYKTLIETNQNDAIANFKSLSKLYTTLGILIGIFLILIFL